MLMSVVFCILIILTLMYVYGLNLDGLTVAQLNLQTKNGFNHDELPPAAVATTRVREKVDISRPCLCYTGNAENTTGNVTLLSNRVGIKAVVESSDMKCAMTFHISGRLGNVMTQYATLYSLAHMNKRPAFMSPGMAKVLRPYFSVTIPAMDEALFSKINWTKIKIKDWLRESDCRMKGQFVQVRNSVPSSFQFYDHLRTEIRREFRLKDEINQRAQNVLKKVRANGITVTYVGVHVRRGDYVQAMTSWGGVVGDRGFFMKATNYFRSRYSDAVFVVVSDDVDWCRENIANDQGDVFFVGNSNETDPIGDFSILVNCNHTVFSVGTFGYWAAYVTGGEVVYLTNFTTLDSRYREFYKTGNRYLPHWIPIEADLRPLLEANRNTNKVTNEAKTTSFNFEYYNNYYNICLS